MQRPTLALVCILITSLIAFTGCYYDKEELLYPGSIVDCNSINARFADVKIIVSAKCATAGCHNAGSAAGGIALETYDQIKIKADRINQRVLVEKTMPPGSPLSPAEVAVIKCWINSGLPNN